MTDQSPDDFLSSLPAQPTVSDQILALAGFNSTKWLEKDRIERIEEMVSATIAWLEIFHEEYKRSIYENNSSQNSK